MTQKPDGCPIFQNGVERLGLELSRNTEKIESLFIPHDILEDDEREDAQKKTG